MGEAIKLKGGVKMEDSPFTWVSIHNDMAEKEGSTFKDYPPTWLPSTKEAVEIDKAGW